MTVQNITTERTKDPQGKPAILIRWIDDHGGSYGYLKTAEQVRAWRKLVDAGQDPQDAIRRLRIGRLSGWGKQHAAAGGRSRAKAMSASDRKASARKAAAARWKKQNTNGGHE